jgi:hypothetical protein
MIVKDETPVVEDPKQLVEGNTATKESNTEVKDPQNPDPPLNKEKVYSYLVSLYDQSGKEYNKDMLRKISSTTNLRYWIDFTHKRTGQKKLDDSGYKKLSSTWIDVKEAEKKNQNVTLQTSIPQNAVATIPTGTDSPSILEGSPTTSVSQKPTSIEDLPQPKVTEYYTQKIDESYSILPVLKQLPRDILEMSEDDASVKFNEVLSDFGYSAEESRAGNNSLTISRPDGTQFDIKLSSDALTDVAGIFGVETSLSKVFKSEKKYNQRLNTKHNLFIMDLALGNQNLVGIISDQMDTNPFGVNEAMQLYTRQMNKPAQEDLEFLTKALTGQDDSNLFETSTGFNSDLFMLSISQLKGNLTPAYNDIIKKEGDYKDQLTAANLASVKTGNLKLPEDPNSSLSEKELESNSKIKSTYKQVDAILAKYQESKRNTSKILGKALKRSNKLADIDLHDVKQIGALVNSGLDMLDMPLPSLLINDKQASFQDIYDLISRPKELGYIQRGDIRLSVDDSVDVGVFNELVKKLKTTQERNTAFLDEGSPRFNSFLRGVADIPQGIYANTLDILNNFGVSLSDALVGTGLPQEVADYAVFGHTGVHSAGAKGSIGLSINKLSLPSKKDVEEAMSLLPEYGGSISDARGAGEFLSYGMQGFTASAPYIAAFMVNPTVGLGVTFGSTYGGSIEQVRDARSAAREAEVSGVILSEKQKDLLKMSNNEARAYALSKAGLETAITAAFTGKYFRQLKLANGIKAIPKTQESAKQLADAFARQNRKGLIANFSKYTGISPKVISGELKEEEFIAYTGYLTDVAFGFEEYDSERVLKLAKDAGLNTLFSSSAMGMGSKVISKNVNTIAEQTINRKITLEGEMDAVKNKLTSDMIVNKLETSGEDSNSPKFKAALEMQREADDSILLFQKRKEDLVSRMSDSHKQTFLNGIVELEGFQAQINETKENPEIFTYEKNLEATSLQKQIDKKKFEMRRILAAYPSELSYYFLPKNDQSALVERALEQLSKEKEGETFSLTSEDSEVVQRASEIYKNDVLENMVPPTENIEVSGYFNDTVAYDDLEIYEEDPDYDVTFDLGQEIILLEKPVEKETKDGDVVEAPVEVEKTEDEKADEEVDKQRQGEIIDRIKKLNLNKRFYKVLNPRSKSIVKKFFEDIKKGERPKFARIETLLKAEEIVSDLKALNQKPITIIDNPKLNNRKNLNPFNLIEDIYPLVNNFGRKLMMGTRVRKAKNNESAKYSPNLMTSDIFLGAIFRNSSKGKPFIDLVSSANRNVARAINTSSEFVNQDSSLFVNDIKAYNKANPKKKMSTDLKNLDTSYEMQVLAHLRRRSGKIDENTGLDTEFQRQKTSLLKELELRREEFRSDPDSVNEVKYRQLQAILTSLGVRDALSYEDVSKNGRQPIVNALDRLSERFPHAETKKRKKDYDGKDTFFEEGTYVPSFRIGDDGKDSSDTTRKKRKESDFGTIAGVFQDIVEDDTLESSRLSFGNYYERAYQQMQGSFIDTNSRADFESMDMIVNSEGFTDLFSDKKEHNLVKRYFGTRMEIFNHMVSQGQNVTMDFGSQDIVDTFGKLGQAFYSTLSATGLSRLNQPASQFYSATTGTMPMLNDSRARNHLQLANARFLYAMAGAGNGQKSAKHAKFASDLINGGQLSNIYSQSRTGLRNALKAEFAIGEKTKLPLDYYVSKFNMDSSTFSDLVRGTQYTVDGFLDLVTKSSEISLELFLANADRAAANSAFESHYLQNRIDQGAIIPKDISAWWKKENENPNTEAIEYADRRIGETMRQTEPTSEAEFYAINASNGTKIAQRTVFPWGKFMLNAKSNFANQYARSKDSSLPETERQEARKRMRGVLNEVAVFNGIKLSTGRVTTIGMVGAAMMQFGADEDDIERYGGMTKLIGDALLPIEDRDYEETLSKMPRGQRETLEGFRASFNESASGIDYTLLELYKTSMEYENKFKIAPNYSVLMQMAADMMKTTVPFAAPDPLYDVAFMAMNEVLGEEVVPEYISRDLDKMGAKSDEQVLLLKENLGMYGVAFEQYDKFVTARTLHNEGVFKKGNTGVGKEGIVEYVAADTPAMQEKLDNIIDYLYYARVANMLLPIPKGDMNNLLNKLERQIEQNFTKSSPSIKGINNAFFKAYLDYRTKEQNHSVDMNNIGKWWEKEQKNMDRSAKKHAIEVIENIRKNAAQPGRD